MDYSITFPQQTISFINASGIIMFSVVFVIGFILLMRYSAKILPGFLGLLAYLIVVVVCTELITYLLAAIPGINGFLLGTTFGFCITRAVIMVLLTHLSRIIVLKFSDRSQNMELGDALMGGLGIAVGQAIIAGFDFLYLSTIATNINMYGLEALLADMEAAEQASMLQSIENTAAIEPVFFLMRGLNCTVDIIFQVAVMLLLYAVIKKGLPAFWHGIIIVFNILLTSLSLFGDYGAVSNFIILFVLKFLILFCVAVMVLKIDTDYLNGELKSFDKLKKKKDSMPKFHDVKRK